MKKTLLLPLALVLGFGLMVGTAAPASAAELTTWQKFIKDKCGGSTADAAARCASRLTDELKDECGAAKDNNRYITCWRGFIRDNGGTAGPNSSPFEEEEPVDDGVGNGAGTCGDVDTAIVRCSGNNIIMSLLVGIVNFMAVGVGIAVVGGITWGAITYIRSNGNSSVAQQGITIIVNSIIGLLLFIFMYAIINFLVPGGLFT